MVPQTQKRKPRNSSKINLVISFIFHGSIVVILLYFAAREGLLGKKAQTVTITMEHKPEKLKEPDKPKQEVVKQEAPKTVAKIEAPKEAPQAPPPTATVAAPPAVAPPSIGGASFDFGGGRAVETSSNPAEIYKSLLEFSLRSKWQRPEDLDDASYVAEVEVSVDHAGQISDPVWKKGSNNKRWDDSVRQAVALTKSVNRPPPTNFPPRVVVRFDVVQSESILP